MLYNGNPTKPWHSFRSLPTSETCTFARGSLHRISGPCCGWWLKGFASFCINNDILPSFSISHVAFLSRPSHKTRIISRGLDLYLDFGSMRLSEQYLNTLAREKIFGTVLCNQTRHSFGGHCKQGKSIRSVCCFPISNRFNANLQYIDAFQLQLRETEPMSSGV